MQAFDMVIVGGGLAGTTLALALQDYPARVAILDAAPPIQRAAATADDRRIALSDNSRQIFETMGLWQFVAKDATAIRTIYVSEQGVFGTMRISAEEEGLPALAWVVPYRQLLSALQYLAMESNQVDFIASAKVKSIDTNGEAGVIVSAEHDEGIKLLRAERVVIADGGIGLQKAAGFTPKVFPYNQTAVVATIETEQVAGTNAYERFTMKGPLAVLPLEGCRRGIVWTQRTDKIAQIMALPDEAFISNLQLDLGNRLGDIFTVGKRSAYPLRRVSVDRLVNGRVLLLGNAAHTLHPVAAQGFNLTLRDIAALAETIFQEQSLQDVNFDEWERNRQRDIRRVTAFTDILARAYTIPALSGARAGALILLDLCPPLRRLFVRGSLGLLPPTSRLASGLPLQIARH